VVKNKNKLSLYLNELLRLGASFENLFISILGIILFCHIAACTWYMLSELNASGGDATFWTARLGFQDTDPLQVSPLAEQDSYFTSNTLQPFTGLLKLW
jgi:hypothetical protein